MSNDEIIEMARQAKLPNSDLYHGNLEAFAKLVAEKCAGLCHGLSIDNGSRSFDYRHGANSCGNKISHYFGVDE